MELESVFVVESPRVDRLSSKHPFHDSISKCVNSVPHAIGLIIFLKSHPPTRALDLPKPFKR